MVKKKNRKEVGIYVHIPFCLKKCRYCDFLSTPTDEAEKERYVQAVLQEIASYQEVAKAYQVRTIYFGGGTPSLLNPSLICDILEKIAKVFSISDRSSLEITLEVNPKTANREKWKQYKAMGINRISIGLQSTHDDELRLLGRAHSYADFLETYTQARECGFHNISIDVMSALPGQTLEKYEETLQRIVELNPEHISSYSLIIEKHTPFWELYGEGKACEKDLPDEVLDRKMYERTKEIFSLHGYERYEISNYAKKGFESKHNSSYWQRIPYIGIGFGASSFFEDQRFHNPLQMQEYIRVAGNSEKRKREVEHIGTREAMEEFMFLGLRMQCGIEKAAFYKSFGKQIEQVYGEVLEKLEKQGVLRQNEFCVFLTDYGIDVSNLVLSEFLLE